MFGRKRPVVASPEGRKVHRKRLKREDRIEKDPTLPSRAEVPLLFDRIASRYDLLNRILSFGMDVRWRRRVASRLREKPGETILDLACGTCDLLIEAFGGIPGTKRGLGVDMAGRMLAIGREKIARRGLDGRITLVRGDGTRLPIADGTIDSAMIAFGIRNMTDPGRALSELYRVLRPGGRLAILEFSLPSNRWVRAVYLVYFRHVLPRVGGAISRNQTAYRYLNRTVESFAYGKKFGRMMESAGFARLRIEPLTFGIATIYCGDKG
jgi:demethylmenaquinone methyltransferase/2-methoxy-6-polyprenyl-1,4-benzoquinol methylase